MTITPITPITVLAAASGGGHCVLLMLLRPTLALYDIRFATSDPAAAAKQGIADAERLPDCNQNMPFQSALCALVALRIVFRHWPQVVISNGAAQGLFCIPAGRLIGALTLWIDSVADGEELSMCGKLSRRVANQL